MGGEDHLIILLEKYKIDITPYIKGEEKPTEPDESFDTIVEFVF